MKTGIYKIECNGKYYIGSSKNIDKRWMRHINDLNNDKHINIHLQRAFNKYGIENFNFSIIEECDVESLLIREQYYLDLNTDGFNIGKHASGGDNLTNNPNREDIIRRISETLKLIVSKMSEEERKEKWGKSGELNYNYGNRWTDEMKKEASIREINNENNYGKKIKGKTNIELYGEEKAKEISEKLSKVASEKIGDKNPFFGKTHTDETKNKIREKRLGSKPVNMVKLSIDGNIYESYHNASNELGIHVTTIRWRCLSDNPKFINYFLV